MQARELKEVRRDLSTLVLRNERMEQQLTSATNQLERVGKRIEIITPTKKVSSNEPVGDGASTPFYSATISLWRKNLEARDYFSNFFYDECLEGYKQELASSSWTRLLPSEQTRIKNHHKKLKKFIKIMLFFCPEYPKPRPESPEELVKWKRDVAHLANAAETALYRCLDPNSKRRKFSFDYILSHPLVKRFDSKEDELNKDLPSNTPRPVRMYFGMIID
ncbi:unknown protein [Seminavis robusta]|uniref:Uncharacterized protein n=1 Tax=Seminavis robusta TaxID=568900 RepID=A0A9N8DF92_9STRA|nr:unknown protein [Seminavis robusta]|eukprot:Sro112_g055880.1 n/a (220) ;mRNA; r:114381-115040